MTERPKPEIEVINPRYAGATPEMVALALLRSPKGTKREDRDDQGGSEPA